jgi:hypothetical protein
MGGVRIVTNPKDDTQATQITEQYKRMESQSEGEIDLHKNTHREQGNDDVDV